MKTSRSLRSSAKAVNKSLTTSRVNDILTTMTESLSGAVDALVTNVRDLLDSSSPDVRLAALRHLAVGVDQLEKGVVAYTAKTNLMTWAEIGNVYEVSRQAVHRRFADATVLSPEGFEAFVAELEHDDDDEPVEALIKAAHQASLNVKIR